MNVELLSFPSGSEHFKIDADMKSLTQTQREFEHTVIRCKDDDVASGVKNCGT